MTNEERAQSFWFEFDELGTGLNHKEAFEVDLEFIQKTIIEAEKRGIKRAAEIFRPAIDILKEIGSGPGYPLDDCPKCDAAKKARKAMGELDE